MSSTRLVVKPAEAPKPVAYLSEVDGYVYIPRKQGDGGGAYNKEGRFLPASYDDITQRVWDRFYTPLYAGTKLIIEPVAETKEIVL